MKSKLLICSLLFFGIIFISGCRKSSELNYCDDKEWFPIIPKDNETYSLLNEKEQSFYGTLTYQECPEVSTLMRCNPYKLNQGDVYTGSVDLKKYVGYEVEVIGKKNVLELEGQELKEIWPIKIRCR